MKRDALTPRASPDALMLSGSPPRRSLAPASVWVIDDNDRLRETVVGLLNEAPDLTCTLDGDVAEKAVEQLEHTHSLPDVVLMDLKMPGLGGLEGTRRIKQIAPSVQVLVLTVSDHDDDIFKAICYGGSGYLVKPQSGTTILDAIRETLNGGAPMNGSIARKVLRLFQEVARPRLFSRQQDAYKLSPREREILKLLVEGHTKSTAADTLFVSPHTVDTHVRNIYEKLHVHSRSKAIAKALKEGLI